MKKYLLIFSLCLAFVLLSTLIWNYTSAPLSVTVVGRGEITNPNANFSITFAITSDANSASDAISSIRTKVSDLKKTITDFGIMEEEIIESQTNTAPLNAIVSTASGYRSTVSLGIRRVPTEKVDAMVALLYNSGVSTVSQPTINTEDIAILEQKAYDLAMSDAGKQAQKIAFSNFKFIYKPIDITKTTTPSSSVTGKDGEKAGYSKIVTQVSVTYKMW
jgi:uncharacterized protein YggE